MIESVERLARQRAGANPTNDGSEKRVFTRVRCLVDLELSVEKSEAELDQVEAIDLSLLGLGFQRSPQKKALELGDTVTVNLPGFQPVKAEVRWNRGSRVGVQFCGRMQDIVESWVGEVLAAQGVRLRDLIARL